jgi:hypothetical protein
MTDTEPDSRVGAIIAGSVAIALGLVAVLDRVGVPLQVNALLLGTFLLALMFGGGISGRTMQLDRFASPARDGRTALGCVAGLLAWAFGVVAAPSSGPLLLWEVLAAGCLLAIVISMLPVPAPRSVALVTGVVMAVLACATAGRAAQAVSEIVRVGPVAGAAAVGVVLVAVLITGGLRGAMRIGLASVILSAGCLAAVLWRAPGLLQAIPKTVDWSTAVLVAAGLAALPALLRLTAGLSRLDTAALLGGAAIVVAGAGVLAPAWGAGDPVIRDVMALMLAAAGASVWIAATALLVAAAGTALGLDLFPARWGEATSARFARLRIGLIALTVLALAAGLMRPELVGALTRRAPAVLIAATLPPLILGVVLKARGPALPTAVWGATVTLAGMMLARSGLVPVHAPLVPDSLLVQTLVAVAAGVLLALPVAALTRYREPAVAPA